MIRVSSGIFYDVPSTNLWYQTFANGGLRLGVPGHLHAHHHRRAVVSARDPTAGASLGTPTIYALTPNYRTPYTINSSIQITRELSNNDALTVGYVNTEARQLTYMRDINLINPTSFLPDGRPVYSVGGERQYAAVSAVQRHPAHGQRSQCQLQCADGKPAHRFSTGFSLNASYTWSHSLSDAPELWGYDQSIGDRGSHNRNRDYGNSIINRPKAFTMSAVFMPTYKLDNHFLNRLANGNQLTLLANISERR